MKKIFTLFSAIALGTLGFGQVVFQSDLQNWTAGDPDGFMGVATHTVDLAVTEVPFGGTYSTSMAQLITTGTAHRRFSTQAVTVVPGNTYQVRIWCTGQQGDLRTGYYYNDGAPQYLTYNSYIDVFAVTGGNLTLLTQNITVPASAPTTGEFIISVLETDATIGIVIDSLTIVQTVSTPPTLVDIYDIQYTADVSGDSPEAGNVVTTRGVVTGVIGFGADADRFFIQDGAGPWRGIYVYENGTTLVLGDSVEVTGTVTEYFGLTELTSVSNITIISSGNPQPAAAPVTTLAAGEEQYESVLVKVADAICNNPSAGFGTYIVNDGSGDRIIDDQIYTYVPIMGNAYDITGVTFLSFSEIKIYPRIAADIVTTGFASVEENTTFSIYPNPATASVKLNVQADALVTIYALTGEMIYQGIGNGLIDVTNFSKGLYQVVVTQNEITSTQKLIVQ